MDKACIFTVGCTILRISVKATRTSARKLGTEARQEEVTDGRILTEHIKISGGSWEDLGREATYAWEDTGKILGRSGRDG